MGRPPPWIAHVGAFDDRARYAAMSPEERLAIFVEVCELAQTILESRPDRARVLAENEPKSADGRDGLAPSGPSGHVTEPFASLVDAVAALMVALERSGIAYALGGAVAYSAWAEPRATRDVDVNLWLTAERLDEGFTVLERVGVSLDRERARAEATERGMFVGRFGEYRVDVFLPSVAFYGEALRQRVRTRVAHCDTWVLSADTLVVFKMLFYGRRTSPTSGGCSRSTRASRSAFVRALAGGHAHAQKTSALKLGIGSSRTAGERATQGTEPSTH